MTAPDTQSKRGARPLWPGLSGEDVEGPYLEGAKCGDCGFVTLGVRAICPQCWAQGRMQPLKLGRRGRVYTRTVVHQGPGGFEAPYAVGMVDLPEGVRVFAHFENGAASPAIGDMVALQIVPLRTDGDGNPLTGPRYRKIS
jgi:uncharacterized OB-fold protein